MRGAAAALIASTGNALAHPGAEGHLHWLGMEHAILLGVILGLLIYAQRRR